MKKIDKLKRQEHNQKNIDAFMRFFPDAHIKQAIGCAKIHERVSMKFRRGIYK
jgi:hypothetical protein